MSPAASFLLPWSAAPPPIPRPRRVPPGAARGARRTGRRRGHRPNPEKERDGRRGEGRTRRLSVIMPCRTASALPRSGARGRPPREGRRGAAAQSPVPAGRHPDRLEKHAALGAAVYNALPQRKRGTGGGGRDVNMDAADAPRGVLPSARVPGGAHGTRLKSCMPSKQW